MDGKDSKSPDTSLESYLGFYHSKAVSNAFLARQLSRHGSLAAVVSAAKTQLESCSDKNAVTTRLLESLVNLRTSRAEREKISEDLLWLKGPRTITNNKNEAEATRSILCFEDKEYPALLREIAVPPPVLYVLGDLSLLANTQIAIVGSRKASAYGLKNATWMAKELAACGLTICSGLALGIDSAAHKAALAQTGATVAVVANGLDRIYPLRNKGLFSEIAHKRGAIISEFPLGTAPKSEHFPQRNRIISGLSLATLVVEAQLKSGSLITARTALEQNREVFTIPGSIHTTGMRGCHWLIKQGALLVESPAEVLETLAAQIVDLNPAFRLEFEHSKQAGSGTRRARASTHSVEDKLILSLLRESEYTLDGLLAATDLSYEDLITSLARLESKAWIELVAGRYRKT